MNHVDELISASLSSDLSDVERRQLETHLADCERCRATLAAFTDQRRLLSGMRHVPVPADLAPRVRSGIESGRGGAAWWRRPGGILALGASLATAAVAVALAVFLFNRPIQVADSSPTPSSASQPASATQLPSESVAPSPSPTASVEPSPSVVPVSNDPAGYLVYTLNNGNAALSWVRAGSAPVTIKVPFGDTPLAAELSPDGTLLAFRLNEGLKGAERLYAYNLADGKLVDLGESLWQPAYGLGGQLAWSGSDYLAYTLFSSSGKPDVWLFRPTTGEVQQLTNTGDAFAASFMPSNTANGIRLWVSRAATDPGSYLVSLPSSGAALRGPSDPASGALTSVAGAYLPLVAPDGKHVIFWRGTMSTPGGHWSFGQGGMPYLAGQTPSGGFDFAGAQQLFPGLMPVGGGEAFNGASIAWGPDSDAFAVWNTSWTGQPQPAGFPDAMRVYLGHVSDGQLITPAQALDSADTSGGMAVIDVAIAPDGMHLALTIRTGSGSEGGTFGATAELRYVTRRLGSAPDVVKLIGSSQAWNGPAVFGTVVGP